MAHKHYVILLLYVVLTYNPQLQAFSRYRARALLQKIARLRQNTPISRYHVLIQQLKNTRELIASLESLIKNRRYRPRIKVLILQLIKLREYYIQLVQDRNKKRDKVVGSLPTSYLRLIAMIGEKSPENRDQFIDMLCLNQEKGIHEE